MPTNPFVTPYVPSSIYDSPNTVAIAELIGRQGAEEAAARRRAGELSGQMWSNLGQTIAGLPAQMQEAKARVEESKTRAQQTELAGLQLGAARREATTRTVFDEELRNPANRNPDGTLNNDKVTTALQKRDVGAWQQWNEITQRNAQNALALQTAQNNLATSQLSADEKRAGMTAAQQKYLGGLAYNAETMLKQHPEDTQHARDTFLAAVSRAWGDKAISDEDARTVARQFEMATPDVYAQLFGQFITPDLRAAYEKEAAAVAAQKATTEKTEAETANLKKYGRETAPTPPEVGSFADYVLRTYGPNPTSQQEEAARTKWTSLDNTPTAAGSAETKDDIVAAVAAMKAGTAPPLLPGRASKEYLATIAEAKRQGFDLARAATDWVATQKHIATMNGAQQLRLNQSINALPDLLDSVDALASKWKGGRFPVFNRANLAAAKSGIYGTEAATIARQLEAQIADVVADLGNVYMGGNSPTDFALGLAAKSLAADWDEKVFRDMVTMAKNNVQIRRNSILNTGVAGASADNPYAPPAPAAAPPGPGTSPKPTHRFNPATGKAEPIAP